MDKKYSEKSPRNLFSKEMPYIPTKNTLENKRGYTEKLKWADAQKEKNEELREVDYSILDLILKKVA